MLEDLRAFLLADSTVSGLLATRIYPNYLPQGVTVPAVTYQVISEERGHVMARRDGVPATRIQIDIWGSTWLSSRAVDAAIVDRLDDYKGLLDGAGSTKVQGVFVDTQRTMYESEPELHRISRDCFVWFEE